MILINPDARKCCCPRKYSATKRLGSFVCPRKKGAKDGPFADAVDSLEELFERDKTMKQYPFCPYMEDILMCSAQSSAFTKFRYDELMMGVDPSADDSLPIPAMQ